MLSFLKHCYIVVLLLAWVEISQAREFYKIRETLSLTYTSIRGGTVTVFRKIPVEVRVSDDQNFCVVVLGGAEFDCGFVSRSDYTAGLFREQWQDLFQHLRATGYLPKTYAVKLGRILNHCEGCHYYVTYHQQHRYSGFSYQIEDGEPEAFHLFVSDVRQPEKM